MLWIPDKQNDRAQDSNFTRMESNIHHPMNSTKTEVGNNKGLKIPLQQCYMLGSN
jgi:hypothetical protein